MPLTAASVIASFSVCFIIWRGLGLSHADCLNPSNASVTDRELIVDASPNHSLGSIMGEGAAADELTLGLPPCAIVSGIGFIMDSD